MEGSLFWETVPLNAELLHHFSRIAVCSAEWWWWVEGRLCSTLPLRQPEPSILEVSHSPECGPSLSRSLEEEKESIENVLNGKGRSNHFLLAELSHMITSGCNLFVVNLRPRGRLFFVPASSCIMYISFIQLTSVQTMKCHPDLYDIEGHCSFLCLGCACTSILL